MKNRTLKLKNRTLTAMHRVGCIYLFGLLMFTSSISAQTCPVDLTLFFENETNIGFGKKVDVVLKAKNSNGTPYLGQLYVTDCNISIATSGTDTEVGDCYYISKITINSLFEGFSTKKIGASVWKVAGNGTFCFGTGDKIVLCTINLAGKDGQSCKIFQSLGWYTSINGSGRKCTISSTSHIFATLLNDPLEGSNGSIPEKSLLAQGGDVVPLRIKSCNNSYHRIVVVPNPDVIAKSINLKILHKHDLSETTSSNKRATIKVQCYDEGVCLGFSDDDLYEPRNILFYLEGSKPSKTTAKALTA